MEDDLFPDRCARGIEDEAWVHERPPYLSAFLFDDDVRDDGYRELSVTWMRHSDSLDVLRKMRRQGQTMFPAGIGVLMRSDIDRLMKHYGSDKLTYESRPTKRNEDHGNILIGNCSLVEERMIASDLSRKAMFYPLDAEIPC